jgi:hypothetical protein
MKIECACGALIHDGTDDLPHKAHVIPDQRWNALFEEIDELIEKRCATATQRNAACTKIRSLIGGVVRLAWQCSACGRLYMDDAKHVLQCYAPESGAAREVFRARKAR